MKIKKYMILLIILLLLSLIFYVLEKSYYTIEEIKLMVSTIKMPTNIYFSEEYYDESNNQTSKIETFVKDAETYVKQYNGEYIIAEYLSKINEYSISIAHDTKTIFYNDNKERDINTTLTVANELLLQNLEVFKQYKYYGKTKCENKNCIKFSLLLNNNNIYELWYYYINIDNNNLIKYEKYIGDTLEKMSLKETVVCEYNYNIVTDNDIIIFDLNNYMDYKYHEI